MEFPTNKKYSVIYADPPWAWTKGAFKNKGRARTVEKEYPTMQEEELLRIKVGEIAMPQSALFLWTTGPKLPVALRVMNSWGFDYKTVAFVWVKRNKNNDRYFFGMGFFTRANAEFCLVGTRGNPIRLHRGVPQIVDSKIGSHSTKPDEVRERIEKLYSGPFIELFARKHTARWDVWGLDVRAALAKRGEEGE